MLYGLLMFDGKVKFTTAINYTDEHGFTNNYLLPIPYVK